MSHKHVQIPNKTCANGWFKNLDPCLSIVRSRLLFGITSIHQPTNAHTISNQTHLKHFKTLRHVSILSDHHQVALFLAKVILQYSHSIRICKRGVVAAYHVVWECVVEQWLGVRRTTHT